MKRLKKNHTPSPNFVGRKNKMIVVYRFEKVNVDIMKDGSLIVYDPETGKILCEQGLKVYKNE